MWCELGDADITGEFHLGVPQTGQVKLTVTPVPTYIPTAAILCDWLYNTVPGEVMSLSGNLQSIHSYHNLKQKSLTLRMNTIYLQHYFKCAPRLLFSFYCTACHLQMISLHTVCGHCHCNVFAYVRTSVHLLLIVWCYCVFPFDILQFFTGRLSYLVHLKHSLLVRWARFSSQPSVVSTLYDDFQELMRSV